MRIEEKYKKVGYFWLPGKEDEKKPGVLSIYDGGRIELEILGSFDDDFNPKDGNNGLKRIIGNVEQDGLITLDGCLITDRKFTSSGVSTSTIFAHKALIGGAWNIDEELTFQTLSFSLDCLDEWVGISGINVDYPRNKTPRITYSQPENMSFLLDNGMRLEICIEMKASEHGPVLNEAKMMQITYFKLQSDVLLNLSVFIETAFRITQFISFAVGKIVAIKKLSASTPSIQKNLGNGKQRPVSILIYYPSNFFPEKSPGISPHEVLFSYDFIRIKAQDIFNNWIKFCEWLSPAIELYFSTKTGMGKYPAARALALIQGLEICHRKTSNEVRMDKEEYTSFVSKLVEVCPEDDRVWLTSRLEHCNEVTLSTRIKRVIEPFKQHIGSKKERSNLVRKIVNTRNFLTHYDDSLKSEVPESVELLHLCSRLELIFNLLLLKFIGFSENEISEIAKRCNQKSSFWK